MQAEEGKRLIQETLGQELKFEGHFIKCFENLKDTQQEELIQWAKDCREYRADPIQSKTNREIIGFVRRFGSNIRAVLIKKKEGYFLVLFLDKHKYYEEEMDKWGF